MTVNGPHSDVRARTTSAALDICDLPLLETYGGMSGRDLFQRTFKQIFANPGLGLLRTKEGAPVVYRNEHLRALALDPRAGNTPPDVFSQKVTKCGYEVTGDEGQAPAGKGAAMVRMQVKQVFFANEPLHTPAKQALFRQLSPKMVAAMVPTADAIIQDLLNEIVGGGVLDFQRDFSEKLTTKFCGRLIGTVAEEDDALLALVRQMNPFYSRGWSKDEVYAWDTGAEGYAKLIEQIGLRAEAQGGYPFVEAMAADLRQVNVPDDPLIGGLSARNIGEFLASNIIDAYHTAAVAISTVVHTILRRPFVLEQLQADSSLLGAAIFESLRIEPPVLHFSRFALEDIVFEGVRIPQGVGIEMVWGAGGLDPAAFPEPETFRLDRPMRGGTNFGGGAQLCPGRNLVGMLIQRTMLALISDKFVFDFNPDDCAWVEHSIMSHLVNLPMGVRRQAN